MHPRKLAIVAGLFVVGGAAAILSFETLDRLAHAAGYAASWRTGTDDDSPRFWLSWLVPISIDAFGFLATLAWLTTTLPARVRHYARAAAVVDIIGSAVLNALFHGLTSAHWNLAECWPLVIGVGAIPPLMVAASLHLGALMTDCPPTERTVRSRSPRRSVPSVPPIVPLSVPSERTDSGTERNENGTRTERTGERNENDEGNDENENGTERGTLVPIENGTAVRSQRTADHMERLRSSFPSRVPTTAEVKNVCGLKSQSTAHRLRVALTAERTGTDA